MSKWAMDAWLVQLFGVVLAGAAVIVANGAWIPPRRFGIVCLP